MNRGGTSNLAAEARAVNDTMYNLSNNQQFLNGVLAYQRADTSVSSTQAMLEALRNAAATQAARENTGGGDLTSPHITGMGGTTYGNGGAYGPLGGGGTSSSFGGYGAFGTGGGTKCAMPVSKE
jgi:hypothetical protein